MRRASLFFFVVVVGCTPAPAIDPVDAGLDAGAEPVDSGVPDAGPPALAWHRVTETPPTRSNQVAFYWPPAQATLIFSGNHNTGPLHDSWSWDGTSWARRALQSDEYPERKNPGLAVDAAGGKAFVFGGVWSGYPPDGSPYTVRTLGDLQRFDGTKWSQVTAASGPGPRAGHAMTWDASHGQLVLFGGSDNVTAFGDTWTFDGQAWTKQTVTPSPSARLNTRMTYDPERGRVVLFGGQAFDATNLDDTWEWDGAQWHDVTGSGARPPGRGHHAMQFDPKSRHVMLMAGARHFSPLPPGSALDDQWEWDGAAWTKIEPQGKRPGPRSAASLSFDARRGVMLLYAGFNDCDLNELWEWDGQRWADRSLLPTPRADFGFAQQAPGGEAVLFGGYVAAGGVYLGDTHRWADGRWSRVTGAAPSVRSSAAIAYHGEDVVLFSGRGATAIYADMWLLKKGETDWVKQAGPLPPARREASMVFDPKRNVTVLFGGRGASAALGDTWEWDGAAWAERTPAQSPPPRTGGRLRWNPATGRVVLLGGFVPGGQVLDDAWSFDGATWTQLEQRSAPTPRKLNTVAFDGFGRLLSWGGYDATTVHGDLSISDGASAWLSVSSGPSARFGAALIDLGGRWQSVFGAQSDFNRTWEDLTDVWELAPAPQH